MSTFLLYHSLQPNGVRKEKKNIKMVKSSHDKCRICLKLTGCVLIFNNELRPNIEKEIYSFTGVLLKQNKKLSNYICMTCVDLLDSCIRFRYICRYNNSDFLNFTIKNEKDNGNNYNINDEVFNKDFDSSENYVTDILEQLKYGHKEITTKSSQEYCCNLSLLNEIPNNVQFYYKNVAIKRKCNHCEKTFKCLRTFYQHLICRNLADVHQPSKVNNLNVPNIPSPCFGPGISKGSEMPQLCDTCGKTFPNFIRLRAHMVIHDNVFPFKCDKCPYKGRTRSLLMSHMKSHLLTSERGYNCPHCQKVTTTKTNLNVHIQRMHKANERKYKCTLCEKMFKCKPDVKRHFVIVHENRGTTKCDVCLKVFNKKHLKKHMWRIHKIQSEKSQFPNRLPSYILINGKTEQLTV